MGLRFVKRLRLDDWKALEAARGAEAFRSLEDFHRRTGLDARALQALSEAGAFETLAEERRTALWKAHGLAREAGGTLYAGEAERAPSFAPLSGFEEIGWDHASSQHSARGHPLAPLRAELRSLGLPDARGVAALADGARARYAGLVICRQRPGTAAGITFMTLEDETGFVNLVVHQRVFERHALLAKTQGFLGVDGRVQRQGEVVHVIVRSLWVPEVRVPPAGVGSRDFH